MQQQQDFNTSQPIYPQVPQPQTQNYTPISQPLQKSFQKEVTSTSDYHQLEEQEPSFTYVKWWVGLIFLALYLIFLFAKAELVDELLDDIDDKYDDEYELY